METNKKIPIELADLYQPLFNHMRNEHDLTLTISEMDEIVKYCTKFVEEFNNEVRK